MPAVPDPIAPIGVTPGAYFNPVSCSQSGIVGPGIPWFTVNGYPVIVTGDAVTIGCPGPSVGTAIVAGTSHWKVNNKSLVKLGIDSAPSLSTLALSGQGTDYFSA